MDNFFRQGLKVLESQPFSSMLGVKLVSLSEGYAELALPVNRSFEQNYGFIHGGVISYMADNCLTFSGATILGNCVTSEYKINYLKPAIGECLIAKSSVLSTSLRQTVCECRIYIEHEGKEDFVAAAQGTIVKAQM